MSICNYVDSTESKQVDLIQKRPVEQKVLEEEEYLGRVASIIKRDFFSEAAGDQSTPSVSTLSSERSKASTYLETPGTDRTNFTSTSSVRSRRQACSLRLNNFLEKYTSEDNAYFEKLQRKDLKRHRLKYPWLHADRTSHNKQIRDQLKCPSLQEQAANGDANTNQKMIDWPYNPRNSLFYGSKNEDESKSAESRPTSTVNYNSSKYMKESIFKEPLLPRHNDRVSAGPRSSRPIDKIGINGRSLQEDSDGTPSVNGYSFIPPPESPRLPPVAVQLPRLKSEGNRFYIPGESPRDDLAHRLYEEKVGKKIRTPKTSTRTNTPKSKRSVLDFHF